MRIWDINPKYLCQKHLIAEHYELHAIWSILNKKKKGYSNHPETIRWKGKLRALYFRHEILVKEMLKRGYNHHSPLDKRLATGKSKQDVLIDSIKKQREILRDKKCLCFSK